MCKKSGLKQSACADDVEKVFCCAFMSQFLAPFPIQEVPNRDSYRSSHTLYLPSGEKPQNIFHLLKEKDGKR